MMQHLLVLVFIAGAAADTDTCQAGEECNGIPDASAFMQNEGLLRVRDGENGILSKKAFQLMPQSSLLLKNYETLFTSGKIGGLTSRFQRLGDLATFVVHLARPEETPGELSVEEAKEQAKETLKELIINMTDAPVKEMVSQLEGVLPAEQLQELDEVMEDLQNTLQDTKIVYMLDHAVNTVEELLQDPKMVDQLKQVATKANSLKDKGTDSATRLRTVSSMAALSLPIFNAFVPQIGKMLDEIHEFDPTEAPEQKEVTEETAEAI